MVEVRTKRRRVRNLRPEVLRAIREELLTGASAPQVIRALDARVGKPRDKGGLPEDSIPSERTISSIAREMRAQASDRWAVIDSSAANVGLVLSVLAQVVRRTEGQVTSLTKEEAALVPVVHEALSSWLSGETLFWQTYVWTRFYLSWVRSEEDAADMALLLAFVRSPGKWPAMAWFRAWPKAKRVQDAAAGWLPEDLLEVRK